MNEKELFCRFHQRMEPIDNFYRNSASKSGYEGSCKEYKNSQTKNWRKKNPEKLKLIKKRELIKLKAQTQKKHDQEWIDSQGGTLKACRGIDHNGERLPISEFGPHKLGKYGVESKCRHCKAKEKRINLASRPKTEQQIRFAAKKQEKEALAAKGMKRCANPNCPNPIQPFDNFPVRKRSVDGKNEYCFTCSREMDRKRVQKNKTANLAGEPRIIRTEKKCMGPLCKEKSNNNGIIKSIEEFHDCISTDDGKMAYCKDCNYYNAHNWQKENPEKKAETNRKIWPQYYTERGGKEVKKKYKREHPEITAKVNHNRRARIQNTTTEAINYLAIRERDQDLCFYCEKKTDDSLPRFHNDKLTYEHLVSLSKGGTNTMDNIVIACWKCNNKKNKRHWKEFRAEIKSKSTKEKQ